MTITCPGEWRRAGSSEKIRIWKMVGVSERHLLDLQCLSVWISNPKVRISRVEVWNNDGPGDLNLWSGQVRHGKVQDHLHLLQTPSEQGGPEAQGAPGAGGDRHKQEFRPNVWCVFPCNTLRVQFGLSSEEQVNRWEREVEQDEGQRGQQDREWSEKWGVVSSEAPTLLVKLSCRLNIKETSILDGQEQRSAVCIHFIQLKGQRPIKSLRSTVHGLQDGCLHLVTEISKICGVGVRRFEDPDLRTSLFANSEGRMEGHILIRSRSDVQSDLEGDILV
jgi:hypothetical protein